jgi:O-antigen/teichoic acid export membrane protein
LSQIRQHLFLTLVSSNAIMVINFATSLVLARLLTPAEIGVFSVAFVFAGLLRTIRELGVGAYIVQEAELTTARVRSAFGVALVMSLLTGAAVALLAPYAGEFYREPGITQVLLVSAATFVLAPVGSTTLALLRRDLRFKEIAIAETFATIVQSISAILFASLGMGYMSLAWSAVVGILASVLAALYYRPGQTPWLPGFSEWRRVLAFCRFTSGSSLIANANGAASDLVLGRMLTMESVAFFNRGQSLADLIGPILFKATNTISLPYFVKAHQAGQSLAELNHRGTVLLAVIAVPIYAVLAILAKPLVLLLYGPAWVSTAPLLQILCLAAIIRTPVMLSSQVMTAIGDVGKLFVLDGYALIAKIGLIILTAPYGLEAVAWSFCVSSLITTVQRLHVLRRTLGKVDGAIRSLLTPLIYPTLLASVGPFALMQTSLHMHLVLPLSLALAAGGWLLGALLRDGPARDEILLVKARLLRR